MCYQSSSGSDNGKTFVCILFGWVCMVCMCDLWGLRMANYQPTTDCSLLIKLCWVAQGDCRPFIQTKACQLPH